MLVSELVVREASGGDPSAARERIEILNQLPLLSATEDAVELAHSLVEAGAIPETAAEDALHIAIAVTNGLDSSYVELSAYCQRRHAN